MDPRYLRDLLETISGCYAADGPMELSSQDSRDVRDHLAGWISLGYPVTEVWATASRVFEDFGGVVLREPS